MRQKGCASIINTRMAFFQQVPPLAGIKSAVWRELLAVAQELNFPAGTQLLRGGDPSDRLVIVLTGTIKVYEAGDNGREITLYRIHEGQLCVLSLTRLLHRTNRWAQAVAEQDVRLLAIAPEHFDGLMASSEDFRRYLIASVAHCVTDVMQLVAEISFNQLDQRLAQLIRRMSDEVAPGELKLTHQDIANELGSTREVVSRLLKSFERAGYIKLRRGCVEVLDREKLETIGE